MTALVTDGNGELRKSCCHTLWRKQTKKNAPIFDAIQRFGIKFLLKKNYSFKINALSVICKYYVITLGVICKQ